MRDMQHVFCLALVSRESNPTCARCLPCAAGVYFVPAFSGLLAPHWRDDARGALLGLSAHSNKCHVVRAVLEGIAFQVRDVIEAVAADSGAPVRALRVDGGAAANDVLMQIQVRPSAHVEHQISQLASPESGHSATLHPSALIHSLAQQHHARLFRRSLDCCSLFKSRSQQVTHAAGAGKCGHASCALTAPPRAGRRRSGAGGAARVPGNHEPRRGAGGRIGGGRLQPR
jgi:ribulose kinase